MYLYIFQICIKSCDGANFAAKSQIKLAEREIKWEMNRDRKTKNLQ